MVNNRSYNSAIKAEIAVYNIREPLAEKILGHMTFHNMHSCQNQLGEQLGFLELLPPPNTSSYHLLEILAAHAFHPCWVL